MAYTILINYHLITCMCLELPFLAIQFLKVQIFGNHISFALELRDSLTDPDQVCMPSVTEYWKPLAEDASTLVFLPFLFYTSDSFILLFYVHQLHIWISLVVKHHRSKHDPHCNEDKDSGLWLLFPLMAIF